MFHVKSVNDVMTVYLLLGVEQRITTTRLGHPIG